MFWFGLAAIDCVIKMLKPGDEVISTNDLYGGSYRLFKTIFEKYGIVFHFVDMKDVVEVERMINENTRLIWIETPTNPLLNIIDIQAMAMVAKNSNLLLCVDNTFATLSTKSIRIRSGYRDAFCAKYLGGHSDVVMGALITSDEEIATEMYRIQNSSGTITSPMDSFLALRVLKHYIFVWIGIAKMRGGSSFLKIIVE